MKNENVCCFVPYFSAVSITMLDLRSLFMMLCKNDLRLELCVGQEEILNIFGLS
jgi:hypothetical protein